MPEARRTIPQLRKIIYALLDNAIEKFGGDQIFADIRAAVEETKRRSPTFPVTRSEHPDPDPQLILDIRKYKNANPKASHRRISILMNTSTRCVSMALSGKRDGTPVYDENGGRYHSGRRRRKTKATTLPDELDPLSFLG
jgi:hypothetical protein